MRLYSQGLRNSQTGSQDFVARHCERLATQQRLVYEAWTAYYHGQIMKKDILCGKPKNQFCTFIIPKRKLPAMLPTEPPVVELAEPVAASVTRISFISSEYIGVIASIAIAIESLTLSDNSLTT
nr:hypothetical protein Itr_chr12CG11180 [Ipomoea trifida]